MIYTNNVSKCKSHTLLHLITSTACFLIALVGLVVYISIEDFHDLIFFSVMLLIFGFIVCGIYIWEYRKIQKSGQCVEDCFIVPDKNKFYEFYVSYCKDRETRTYEELLPAKPKYYKVMDNFNYIFAVLSITIGILALFCSFTTDFGFLLLVCLIFIGLDDIIISKTDKKLLLLLLSCLLSLLLYTPVRNNYNIYRLKEKVEANPSEIKETEEVAAKTVTFYPQNAVVIDDEGSHNFTSYDCPTMNVTDRRTSVTISWGGDSVVLPRSSSNEDTYRASYNSSRGQLTMSAYRSSASGKIYLVTAVMLNPSPDVQRITINFKP